MTDTDALRIADGYTAMPYGDGYIIHHESGGAWAADLAMVAAVREIERLRAAIAAPGVPPGRDCAALRSTGPQQDAQRLNSPDGPACRAGPVQ